VSFSKDHHFGLLLVWKIRQGLQSAIAPERISNYVLHVFRQDLSKHFLEEEQLLFVKLPENDVLRKRAEADHACIYGIMAGIDENRQDVALLTQLANYLENHIRFEERALFNHLQGVLLADELEAIARRFPNNSKGIDEGWTDMFWEISHRGNGHSDKTAVPYG
jgi:iron-sulfur cluster repair protein YtfE (RIC family)